MLVDSFGNGWCRHCGWVQSDSDYERPDEIRLSGNFVSFNQAKQLLAEGKPITPDFPGFLQCLHVYGEMEFFYDGKQYGVLAVKDGVIHFYEWNVMDKGYQVYPSIDAFAQSANINGTRLRDIWDAVERVGVAS